MSEITIRTARLDDASKLVSIYRYYVEKTAITFEYEVPTVAEFRRRMGTMMQKYPYLVIEEDGVIQGYAMQERLIQERHMIGRVNSRFICRIQREKAVWAAGCMKHW